MYHPFNIGSKFRITPPNMPCSEDRCVDLIMQRGAFGSGEHETTESCLEILETRPEVNNSRLLDLGSGTGILAIAALKLGASHAVCVDIEKDAVESARVNCQLNQMEQRVTHITGTLEDVKNDTFDLILANIYGDILLDLAEPLTVRLKTGGTLLLSGILWEYNFDVRQAYERTGCEVVCNRMLEEFSTILMVRKS